METDGSGLGVVRRHKLSCRERKNDRRNTSPHRSPYTFSIPGMHLREWQGASPPMVFRVGRRPTSDADALEDYSRPINESLCLPPPTTSRQIFPQINRIRSSPSWTLLPTMQSFSSIQMVSLRAGIGGARRMLGYDASEAIGLHFSRLYTEDAIARGWPQKALLLAKRHRKLEDGGWLMRKDGSRFWCSNSITAVYNSDDALIGMGMVIRDVTQQMESSERLRESELSDFLCRMCTTMRFLCLTQRAASLVGTLEPTASRATRAAKLSASISRFSTRPRGPAVAIPRRRNCAG